MKKIYCLVMTAFISAVAFAQEKAADVKVDVTESTSGGNWYTSPWVWVIGAALFILLLIALAGGSRGSSRRVETSSTVDRGDNVTVTKTVRRDSDVDPDLV
jgi:hypothetical protein